MGRKGPAGLADDLESSAVNYEDFFENAAVGLHVVDGDGRIVHANSAELKLLGYEPDDYIGKEIAGFYEEEAVIRDIMDRLKRGEKVYRYPARLKARDGSVKHVEVSSSGYFKDGQLVHTRCFTVDVTPLKTAERVIGQQEARFNQILDALPVAIYTTDAEGKITYYNRAAAELAGREPKIGEDEWCVTFRLFTPDGKPLPHDECPMAIALKENRPVRGVEAIAQRPDGSFFPFMPFPTPLRNDRGELTGAVNMLFDLTDRKLGEDAAQHLSAIVESSFDAIVSKNLDGFIKTWNQGAERLFGYTADEAVGKHITMLFPPEYQDEEAMIIERIRQGGRVESFETIRRRKDGTDIPVSLTISPVRDGAGRIVGASKIARDITSAKESEERIRMLMREVNHRVKNQYAVILSMIRETNKRSDSPDVFEKQVRERIMALSRSHDLLVSADWKGATVADLLLAQAKPFGREEAIALHGPALVLTPNAVQYLGIAFHELCTNSAKYGVLSGRKGSITLNWNVTNGADGRIFQLAWTEKDGPKVKAIVHDGFGTVVLNRVAPEALNGTGGVSYDADQVVWSLQAPLAYVDAFQRGAA
ncbi:PAS domain S-box protein [Mesorhizobium sp. M2D.F.Ca.ET.185.01.1.1]|nr:PAS domain S-box protein [Mesorhizobium sp. M2D.F.Ca.ET.140.01.1.1]TGP16406.1 PAS domain S-box protein [Mesorhizobium sp. M2D.F.Ca.ET.233.01.1.1]TGP36986.1 PAS domain S-box protein [Mesorhizobium sp. M2D.F.Ca.ET.232.01.1.1]TGP65220.1 PAS domain S-box protein [Mesorhizobium sp. M2D.F.Ca.ET.226.01.1.1]TGP71697.1 PAS domain S-box protein [Mesorhizobium sp. M2D.F.Ca.ET.225.01.1.1]TGP74637.1 PAS domain S-box protein [Mesorhizobium sp. M2D.F.Ca.ET.224.01.1.1]TGP77420.1 PAS domain S-box protein [